MNNVISWRWLQDCLRLTVGAERLPAEQRQEIKLTVEKDAPKSLDIVYQEAKERLALQHQQIATLDSKANFGLGSSTLLTAAVSFQDYALQQRLSSPIRWLVLSFVLGALVLYVRTVCAASEGYRLRTYMRTGEPKTLLELLKNDDHVTKQVLLRQFGDAYESNQREIEGKVKATKTMLRCLLYQALVVSGLVVLRVIL